MTTLEVIDKIARGDVDVLSMTFPEGLTIAEMAEDLRGAGVRPGRHVHQRGDTTLRRFRRSTRRAGSRGLPVSGHLRAPPAGRRRREPSAPMVERFQQVLTPEVRAAPRREG